MSLQHLTSLTQFRINLQKGSCHRCFNKWTRMVGDEHVIWGTIIGAS